MVKNISNWINGKKSLAVSKKSFNKINPNDGSILFTVTSSNKEDINEAVNIAFKAQISWHEIPPVRRGLVLHDIVMSMMKSKDEIAEIVHLETGKSMNDALGETNAAIECGLFFASEGQRLYARTTTSGVPNKFASIIRQPVGIAGLIIAANTPIANVAWKVFPALICGNSAILKAAEDSPATSWIFGKIAHEAGLPPGVLNIIQGYGNVGSPTASKLRAKGAIIVGASDINTGLWDPEGLNIELLNKIRKIPGGLRNYTGNTQKRFDSNQVDWLLEAPCDILVPAARPDAITARNAHRIQCKVILQGANAPVNKMTEYYLKNRRGIISLSDFIVNSGGIIGCAVELTMKADEAYKEKIEAKGIRVYAEELIDNTISKNVSQVLSKINAEGSDITFQEEGLILAKKRLEKPREIWI